MRLSLILLAGFFLSFALRLSIAPYMKELVDFFGVDYAAVGGLTSAFLVGYALLRFPAGWAADKSSPRRLLTIGYIVSGCSWLVFLLAGTNFQLALVAVFLTGVGAAMLYSPAVKMLASIYGEKERGLVFGAIQTSIGLGSAFSLGVMPALMGAESWRLGFGLYPLLALFLVICVQKIPNYPETVPGVPSIELIPLNSDRRELVGRVLLLLIPAFFTFFGPFGVTVWFPTYLREARGLPIQQASLIASLVSVMHTSAGPFAGRFSDRLGSRLKVYLAGSLIMLVGIGLITYGHLLGLIVTAALLIGFGIGSVITILLLYAVELLGLERAGIASGMLGTLGQLASALSVAVIGSLISGGISFEIIWVVTGGSVVTSLITLLLSNKLRSGTLFGR